MRDAGVDPRVHANSCLKKITEKYIRVELFLPDGEPDPARAEERAILVTQSLMRPMDAQDRAESQSLSYLFNKMNKKEEKKSEGLDWLDDEHFGKTISDEPGIGEVTGAHISYTSSAPSSAAYRYRNRGLSADLVVKARSIDLIDIRVEGLYPRTKTRVDVVMSDAGARRIAEAIRMAAEVEARRAYSMLRIASRHDPFVACLVACRAA